jgi:TetR/AcrR family acrAB operon transcriptional repressor
MYVNGEARRVARRTKEEAEGTRTRIVDAAERVFRDKGVAHASLEDVAAAARVTRGAIYWHFKDKAELFEAMMRRVELPAQALMERAGAPGAANPLEILRASACEVLLRAARDAQVRASSRSPSTSASTWAMPRHPHRQLENQSECLATIEQGIRDCMRQGLLPRPSTEARGARRHGLRERDPLPVDPEPGELLARTPRANVGRYLFPRARGHAAAHPGKEGDR